MKKDLPSIIITGASGLIGSYILQNLLNEYNVFAIARRSRKVANIPYHQNLQWIQCDIANWNSLKDVMNYIKDHGGAKFVIHLAAYYDFTYEDNPEYERTNIKGTENVLKFSKEIGISRFIFASSLAACQFSDGKTPIDENSPLVPEYQYAYTKKIGEELVEKYSKDFSCTIIRLAAVFSDWCEYAVLYKFLESWLSHSYYSRMLAGKGESAIPYIHVHDLYLLFKNVLAKSDRLTNHNILIASPDGSTSHNELFEIATRYYLGESIKPIYLPKAVAYLGIVFRTTIQKLGLTSNEYFERLWMLKYLDNKLRIDSSKTRRLLDWNPTPRYHILRRMLFLLEKMKSHPDEWKVRNEAALKRITRRPNFLIYERLIVEKENLLEQITEKILAQKEAGKFKKYQELDREDFNCYMSTLYHLLMAAVRSGDRGLMIQYIDDIALRRFAEGFEPEVICNTLTVFREIIVRKLESIKEFSKIKQDIYDYISLTTQLAQDEIEDLYEDLLTKMPKDKISESALLPDCKELQKMIRQLSAFYQISPEEGKYYEDLR
jgi:nucleoside-diphosphate-sugar epimerase